MAKSYYDVSKEHMIDQIAGLGGVLALQNNDERDIYLQQVAGKTKTTSNKIKNLATERQREYSLMNLDRQKQYMQFIQEGMLQELNNLGTANIG